MAENAIDLLVKQVMAEVGRLSDGGFEPPQGSGIFDNMNDAIEACWKAQKEYMKLTMADRKRITDAIRKVANDNAELLSKLVVEESGMGNVHDKIIKHHLVADKTPGIEDLRAEALTGDDGLTLFEMSPFGVIGAITPSTNPTCTLFNNGIGMLAGGNGVVFSPHPGAKSASLKTIAMINQAIIAAGAPPNLITAVKEPTIEATEVMMKHPKVNMLVATGGPGVVHSVLSSGKKAIGAGAGNPPVVVDATANIDKAAIDIINGCSFDNNLPCIAEKEVIVEEKVADYLIFAMKGSGLAYFIEDKNMIDKLCDLVTVNNRKSPNKKYVGRSAQKIMADLGVTIDPKYKVICAEVPFDHPFIQVELMMPVLGITRAKNFSDAADKAIYAEHGNRHTAEMHSRDVEHLSYLAKNIQTTIFVKNAPSYAGIGVGGEGHTCFTIAGPTGEGLTSARTFTRKRRCVLVDAFNIK